MKIVLDPVELTEVIKEYIGNKFGKTPQSVKFNVSDSYENRMQYSPAKLNNVEIDLEL